MCSSGTLEPDDSALSRVKRARHRNVPGPGSTVYLDWQLRDLDDDPWPSADLAVGRVRVEAAMIAA